MLKCFICNKEYTIGISVCCSRKCHNIRINSQRNYQKLPQCIDKSKREIEYKENPKICLNPSCENIIQYTYRSNKFCSHSCSATFNNKRRKKEIYVKSSTTLINTLNKKFPVKSKKVILKLCPTCSNNFEPSRKFLKYCSTECLVKSPIRTYRNACKFKFSKLDFPHLYKTDLLESYGWYRAANHKNGYNPDGMTWDHLFRIEDGYKLGIDPTIISHPANAEMISWKENIKRRESMITYTELLQRIERFENLYGGPARYRPESPCVQSRSATFYHYRP